MLVAQCSNNYSRDGVEGVDKRQIYEKCMHDTECFFFRN